MDGGDFYQKIGVEFFREFSFYVLSPLFIARFYEFLQIFK